MKEPAAILASESISVVDDVSSVAEPDSGTGPDEQNFEARDLGDGYVEINGYVFYENWDEIDPPGSDDEPEIPHEEVVVYLRDRQRNLRAGR
jgi:hypothetical protein